MTRFDPPAPADTQAVPTPQYEGRVEITWTNQHRRLLARDDNTYEWVPAHDERVSEVRLLDSVAVVGPTHDDEQRAADNLLIRGDALHALRSLASLPEFRDEYLGKVKLCYIDPPFPGQLVCCALGCGCANDRVLAHVEARSVAA